MQLKKIKDSIISFFDKTEDKKLNYDDFILIFQELDTDKDGKIERKEVIKFLFTRLFKVVF